MNFPRGRYALVLTIALLLQGGVYYAVASRSELTPPVGPLSDFPMNLGGWSLAEEYKIDVDTQAVLRADDILSRRYVNPADRGSAQLFIAFFKTQRYGQAPHSPKNCLPGAGWEQEPGGTGTISLEVPGWSGPIVANRYLVSKGADRVLTVYWYQSHNRIIASEYSARFWLVLDAIRYRRSDTSLVRVTIPVRDNDNPAAERRAREFIQAAFPAILKQLPI